MELKPALGSLEMQRALNSPYVCKIVDGLLQLARSTLFSIVARFLKDHDQDGTVKFANGIRALKLNAAGRPNANGEYTVSPNIEGLVSNIEALYAQDKQEVDFQRGAIIEVLTSKLVQRRCKSSECYGNYRFAHGRYSSNQIDMSVFSAAKKRIEAYTCKINCNSLECADCTNLTALAQKADELYYEIHLGVVCFDPSSIIQRRISDRLAGTGISTPLKAYGLDNLFDLAKDPF